MPVSTHKQRLLNVNGGEWKANRTVKQKGITRVVLSRQSLIIIEEILKQIDSNTIPCYTEVKKSDGEGGWETYHAHPKFYGEQWNDFVLIKWSTEREPLPALITRMQTKARR
jgi:hypothetical protein